MFVKKPSLCSQRKIVFTHPAQRVAAKPLKVGGQITTSWPSNNAK